MREGPSKLSNLVVLLKNLLRELVVVRLFVFGHTADHHQKKTQWMSDHRALIIHKSSTALRSCAVARFHGLLFLHRLAATELHTIVVIDVNHQHLHLVTNLAHIRNVVDVLVG